jgi:hypothetical protein
MSDAAVTGREIHVLRAVEASANISWLPWRGFFGTAKRLAKNGYLIECGAAAMWPHKTYVLSGKGRAQLVRIELTQDQLPGFERRVT